MKEVLESNERIYDEVSNLIPPSDTVRALSKNSVKMVFKKKLDKVSTQTQNMEGMYKIDESYFFRVRNLGIHYDNIGMHTVCANNVPFDDFVIFLDKSNLFTDNDKDNVYIRCLHVDNGFIFGVFNVNVYGNIILTMIGSVEDQWSRVRYDPVSFDKLLLQHSVVDRTPEEVEVRLDWVVRVVRTFLYNYQNMEMFELNDIHHTESNIKKLPHGIKQFYQDYIIDLTKPKQYRRDMDSLVTHASPCDHMRRGHWRMTKKGNRIWIKASRVNPGVGKKREKAYKV